MPKAPQNLIEPLTTAEIDQLVKIQNPLTALDCRNNAILVLLLDTGLRVSELIEQGKEDEIDQFVDSFIKFMRTLKWQISKGVQMDESYYDLLKFQTHVTQAAGEKYAIQNRHEFWCEYFYHFKTGNVIKGDKEYLDNTGQLPDAERDAIEL